MIRIKDAITEIFPDFNEKEFRKELKLGDIPNYDSMNAINLYLSLEDHFEMKLDVEQLPLNPSHRIIDLIDYLGEIGIKFIDTD